MPDPEWVYFDFTSVAYRRDDPFGELLALFSLAPVFAMVAYATAIAARRDLQTLILLVGQVGRIVWPRARARALDAIAHARFAARSPGARLSAARESRAQPRAQKSDRPGAPGGARRFRRGRRVPHRGQLVGHCLLYTSPSPRDRG